MYSIIKDDEYKMFVNRRGRVAYRRIRRRRIGERKGIIKENDKYMVSLNEGGIGFINKSNNNSTECSISLNTDKIIMNNDVNFNAREEFI